MSDLNSTCFNNIHGGNAVTSPIIVNSFSPSLLYQSISMDTCIPGYLISMDTFLLNYVLITYSWDVLSFRNHADIEIKNRKLEWSIYRPSVGPFMVLSLLNHLYK